MKGNRTLCKRALPLLFCGMLCASLLAGCSDVLPSLAEGVGQVTGALADWKDEAVDAATGETDGEVKDAILNAYGALVDAAGFWALTPDRSLQGVRVKGEDDYTGTYEAAYDDFSGAEVLSGGTTLGRAEGSTLELSCSITVGDGEASIFLRSGSEEPVVLLSESGDYASTIEVDGGSADIGVWGENVTGSVSIQVG